MSRERFELAIPADVSADDIGAIGAYADNAMGLPAIVAACSEPGRDASPYVAEALRLPAIAAQLDAIGLDKIRDELRGYGAWSEAELSDDAENRARILWCAACNIQEED